MVEIQKRQREREAEGTRRYKAERTSLPMLPSVPSASQCLPVVFQLTRTLATDRAFDVGRQAPGSENRVFSSLPFFKVQNLGRENARVISKFKSDFTYTGSPLEIEIVKHWLDATLIFPGAFEMQK